MFSYTNFKAVMDISDIAESTYAFVMRTVFQYVLKVHVIDIDNIDPEDITEDLQYAMYLHAKYIYETQVRNTPVVESSKDSGGNTVKYNTKMPSIITSTYRMYSPSEPVLI